jgi:hypothetical protein
MTVRRRVAFRLPAAGALLAVALAAGAGQARAEAAIACAGLASLEALADTLRLNQVDPFVAPAAEGGEPLALAVVPADSDAVEAAALAFKLRRLLPSPEGPGAETLILPRARPARERPEATPAPPKTQPVTATSDAYRKFIADLTYIAKLRLDDPKNLARARQLLVNHNLISLARGWIAWCGEIAAQSQEFVNGVEKAAGQNGGADNLKSTIAKQPFTVLDFGGWQSASLAIRKQIAEDSALMASVAWRLSEIAYGRTANEAHLAQEANKGNLTSAAPRDASPSVSAASTLGSRSKPIMTQMLALGAHLHLSNASTVGLDPAATAMATNKDNDQCLRWAQLNLDQCLAAARDNQERAYCLGKQGIEERAKCWSWILSPQS